jgi:hypothetical protein
MMKEYKWILQKIATIKPNSEYSLSVNDLADFTPLINFELNFDDCGIGRIRWLSL